MSSSTAQIVIRRESFRWQWGIERPVALVLALCTSLVALSLAAAAAMDRAGPGHAFDQLLITATAVALALGAQLLPAFGRSRPGVWLLWLACLVATLYGHAHFFAASGQRAGEARAEALAEPLPMAAWRTELAAIQARPLATLAAEEALVQARAAQAELSLHRCERQAEALAKATAASRADPGACESARVGWAVQQSRLDAVRVELAEARRAQGLRAQLSAAATAWNVARAQAQQSAVDTAFAQITGLPLAGFGLFSSLAQSLLLELLAALLWWVAARPSAGAAANGKGSKLRPSGRLPLVASAFSHRTAATTRSEPALASNLGSSGPSGSASRPHLPALPTQASLFEEPSVRQGKAAWGLRLAASR
jgi:hypothetical protein